MYRTRNVNLLISLTENRTIIALENVAIDKAYIMLELLVPSETANCSDRTASRELLRVGKPTDRASIINADQFLIEIPKIFLIGFFFAVFFCAVF